MIGIVGDAIDAASGALSGEGTEPVAQKGKAEFVNADFINTDDRGAPGATAPGVENQFDGPMEIRFIHFGHVYKDMTNFFHHEERSDVELLELDDDECCRALAFRSALMREMLLLRAFIRSSQAVADDYSSKAGALGEIANVAGGLMGGGPSVSAGEQGDPVKKLAEQAGGAINVAEIKYADLHQAGIDLHQARADHTAYVDGLGEAAESGGGSPLDALPLPDLGDSIGLVTGITFKAMDIYLAMYKAIRKQTEPQIELVCREFSLKTIRAKTTPMFPIWFPEAPSGDSGGDNGDGGGGVLGAFDDVMDSVDGFRNDVNEFLNGPSEDAPGKESLEKVFAGFQDLGDCYEEAFCEALDLGSLPEFVGKIIAEIANANAEFLALAYLRIMVDRGQKPINQQVMLEAGRSHLFRKIISIVAELVPFLSFLKSGNPLGSLQGMSLTGEQIGNKAAEYMDAGVGQYVEHVLKLTVADAHARLEVARSEALDDKALSMEVLLGRLPWIYTLMVRNTFFPIWDMLLDKIFGAITGGLSQGKSPVKGFLSDAEGYVNDVKNTKDNVENARDKLAEGVDLNPGTVMDAMDTVQNITSGPGDDDGGDDKPLFPPGPRLEAGVGVKFTAPEEVTGVEPPRPTTDPA